MNNSISIIVPVYNEKDSLEELYGEIRNATGSFSKREVLFIDDGSTDGSTEILKTMAEEYADVVLIQFFRNYGKAAALAEGLGLGNALGINLEMLREVFSQTGAASRVLETDGEDMENRDHECYFSAAHAAKDSGIALNLAKSAELELPLAQATFNQYQQLVEARKGELDKSGVAELVFKARKK